MRTRQVAMRAPAAWVGAAAVFALPVPASFVDVCVVAARAARGRSLGDFGTECPVAGRVGLAEGAGGPAGCGTAAGFEIAASSGALLGGGGSVGCAAFGCAAFGGGAGCAGGCGSAADGAIADALLDVLSRSLAPTRSAMIA